MDRSAKCVCQFGRGGCSVPHRSDPVQDRILFSGILIIFHHPAGRCSLLSVRGWQSATGLLDDSLGSRSAFLIGFRRYRLHSVWRYWFNAQSPIPEARVLGKQGGGPIVMNIATSVGSSGTRRRGSMALPSQKQANEQTEAVTYPASDSLPQITACEVGCSLF